MGVRGAASSSGVSLGFSSWGAYTVNYFSCVGGGRPMKSNSREGWVSRSFVTHHVFSKPLGGVSQGTFSGAKPRRPGF